MRHATCTKVIYSNSIDKSGNNKNKRSYLILKGGEKIHNRVHSDSKGTDLKLLKSVFSDHVLEEFDDFGHGGPVLVFLSPHALYKVDDLWTPLLSQASQ